jgi:hypothetical protein
MRTRASIALLLPLACLLGCTLPYTPPASSFLSGNWSNWQFQTGTAITPNTSNAVIGALQLQGTQVTGIFSGTPLCGTPQILNFTGTYDLSTGALALQSKPAYFDLQLAVPPNPTTMATGTLAETGQICALATSAMPAVGVQIAPLNGTYAGTFTESASTVASPIPSGTVSLALTQSTTPNASGAFSLTGTLTFPSNSGFGTYKLSGMISGEGITLYDPTPGIVPVVSLTASTNPAATQITVSNLALAVTASDIVTFTGTLTLQ